METLIEPYIRLLIKNVFDLPYDWRRFLKIKHRPVVIHSGIGLTWRYWWLLNRVDKSAFPYWVAIQATIYPVSVEAILSMAFE